MSINKIVITGGPCGGKTTALSRIREYFEQIGYKVMFVSETATDLISNGITPDICGVFGFQSTLYKIQYQKEQNIENAAKYTSNNDKVLIVCDRGLMDNKAYVNQNAFNQINWHNYGKQIPEIDILSDYDAVFHLVSAAKGAEKYYTLSNNTARSESIEEAAALDDKLISAWTGHNHFRVIDNSTDFEGKMKRLITEIASFLGEPEPIETERKFVIEKPNIAILEANPFCRKVDIAQTYLRSNNNEEVRVRKRGIDGSYTYYKTTKRKIDELQRYEVEERISEYEYNSLLKNADKSKTTIFKTRYCLVHDSQYFEIDIYPLFANSILEIEVADKDTEVRIPDFVKVIKEVTGEEEYSNSYLAKTIKH